MNKPMTEKQSAALAFIADQVGGKTSAYDLKIKGMGNLGVIRQLAGRGMLRAVGIGHSAFPRNAAWVITDKGRAHVAIMREAAQ